MQEKGETSVLSKANVWINGAKEECVKRPETVLILVAWVAFGLYHAVGFLGRPSDDE